MKNVNRMGYRSSQTPDMSSLLSRDHQILKVIVISHFIVFCAGNLPSPRTPLPIPVLGVTDTSW